jgi:hypothetical protein
MRGTESEPGIVPLAVHEAFSLIQQCQDREFLLRVSYMEVRRALGVPLRGRRAQAHRRHAAAAGPPSLALGGAAPTVRPALAADPSCTTRRSTTCWRPATPSCPCTRARTTACTWRACARTS